MSTLFTAVSVEQQETVAGGAAIALETLNQFVKEITVGATSGANGNGAVTNINLSNYTSAISLLRLAGTDAQ